MSNEIIQPRIYIHIRKLNGNRISSRSFTIARTVTFPVVPTLQIVNMYYFDKLRFVA